jgi:putative transposase
LNKAKRAPLPSLSLDQILLKDALQELQKCIRPILVSDGGSENINFLVNELTTREQISHVIAQKDISFSNSTIEALNKVLKHQFLLPLNLQNLAQLTQALDTAIHTYNNLKRYCSKKCVKPDKIRY